jgi:RNA-directed DNA polymerase
LAAQLKLFNHLDQWIRRRIRMCYWKRWRHVRMRIHELIALGVQRRQAIRHGKSRKGYWRMAKSIASGVGLTNAWLQAQGLLSLKTLWAQLAPHRRTAQFYQSKSVTRVTVRIRTLRGVGRVVSTLLQRYCKHRRILR